jgi:hypothetical protein
VQNIVRLLALNEVVRFKSYEFKKSTFNQKLWQMFDNMATVQINCESDMQFVRQKALWQCVDKQFWLVSMLTMFGNHNIDIETLPTTDLQTLNYLINFVYKWRYSN